MIWRFLCAFAAASTILSVSGLSSRMDDAGSACISCSILTTAGRATVISLAISNPSVFSWVTVMVTSWSNGVAVSVAWDGGDRGAVLQPRATESRLMKTSLEIPGVIYSLMAPLLGLVSKQDSKAIFKIGT